MKWIYTGVIRPKLTYGCIIWGPKANTKVIKQKLKSLNRLAALLVCKITRTTPQMALEIIFNIEPLDIVHILRMGMTAYKRLENHLDDHIWASDSSKSHLQYWKNMFV